MTATMLVLWSSTDDDAFIIRYTNEHIPLINALPGLEGATVRRARSRAYSLVAELRFPDPATMKSAFSSEQGVAVLAHTAALTDAFGTIATSVRLDDPI
jgi:uncharacterized protein (TIGR02118 family)